MWLGSISPPFSHVSHIWDSLPCADLTLASGGTQHVQVHRLTAEEELQDQLQLESYLHLSYMVLGGYAGLWG